jgi:hypothetical protein
LSSAEGPGFLRYLAGGFYRRHCDVLSESDEEFPAAYLGRDVPHERGRAMRGRCPPHLPTEHG